MGNRQQLIRYAAALYNEHGICVQVGSCLQYQENEDIIYYEEIKRKAEEDIEKKFVKVFVEYFMDRFCPELKAILALQWTYVWKMMERIGYRYNISKQIITNEKSNEPE